ncbi:MAG: metallophosphoesterase [Tannerella sp.]|jgi:3',5'-cyclic AMP phosphodiesterase CpdA|nr:metallophosphoesterase [Tannerella sp.]
MKKFFYPLFFLTLLGVSFFSCSPKRTVDLHPDTWTHGTIAPDVPKKTTFAFLTDIHLNKGNERYGNEGLLQALDKVKASGAEFIVLGGDLMGISGSGNDPDKTEADSMFLHFKQTMETTGLPYYHAIGNHDRYFDESAGYVAGDELYKTHFGHSYYSFEQKGLRFFVLNSVYPNEKGLEVGADEMEWLKTELLHVPDTVPIVVVTHVPIYSICVPVVRETFTSLGVIANYREVLKAFSGHNLRLVLQGHQHLYEEIFSQDVQYITGGAVCAAWWTGDYHGTEEGFLLVSVDEANHFSWQYIDFGWTPKKKI